MTWLKAKLKPPGTGSRYFPLGVVVASFILSRFVYNLADIRFDARPIFGYWQYIDPYLLRNDLWRSIVYLHTQPPLMNLFIGLILQLDPSGFASIFHGIYWMCGLTLAISIYSLSISLKFSPWGSALFAIWFVVSPAAILYENWLAYAYPLTCILTLAAACLGKYIQTGAARWGWIFFGLLTIPPLTWALFHIIWLVAALGVMLLLIPSSRKVWPAALLAFLLVSGWYTKNLIVFGEFTSSTWAGMNLAKISTFRLDVDDREELVNKGLLTEFGNYPPFRNPDLYLRLLPATQPIGVPLLDNVYTIRGNPNRHHFVYIEASLNYLKDALQTIQLKPGVYLRSIGQAFYIYFHSASDFDLIIENRARIHGLDLWWNRIFYGQWFSDETPIELNSSIRLSNVGWFLVIYFLSAVSAGLNYLRKNRTVNDGPEYILIVFMLFNILFVTAVGNTFDIGENNRFRYVVDPFILLLFIYFVKSGLDRFKPGSSSAAS